MEPVPALAGPAESPGRSALSRSIGSPEALVVRSARVRLVSRRTHVDRDWHWEVSADQECVSLRKRWQESCNRLLDVPSSALDYISVGTVRESVNDHRSHLAEHAFLDVSRPLSGQTDRESVLPALLCKEVEGVEIVGVRFIANRLPQELVRLVQQDDHRLLRASLLASNGEEVPSDGIHDDRPYVVGEREVPQ